ncbi:leucine-rich repeat receptor protein kinase HPCA1-like isoform X3 [Rhododendron vialii]|uniref:leucine-rich repeat receptor protein kinase HPCA1-like isoform X3 n=1 Tax=Rhododendron vialii TaxID=182163 RepID=UPI00265F7D17|nr:leucine-rich repeat receptor protein kinase HPCA1-like isoform X3 [Rhododendron vialii]
MGLSIEICLLVVSIQFLVATALTNSQDLDALEALNWTNTPPNWVGSDPCGSSWEGIQCTNSRITSITLGNIGLTGQLSGDIAQLSELQMLDLSYNNGLTGTLTPSIGSLTKLTNLILEGCGFFGPIPGTLGSLQQLRFLVLNSNSFSGSIPPSIGNLSKLYWLDLANNGLSGTIPVSSGATPGLDMLVNTKHFHFGNNRLSGAIPSALFSSNMTLIHVLFENNQLNGSIPSQLALVQTLEVVRLDGNLLTGFVPSQFSNLINVNVLYLSNNQLSGPFPNLSTMNYLDYVDLSNNTFDASVIPSWLSNLQSLTTIVMENTTLYGSVPGALFSLPQLQTVTMSNNKLNGTLDVGSSYSNQLKLVDLQNNLISGFTQRAGSTIEFILVGNPVCTGTGGSNTYCVILQPSSSYSTPPNNCIPSTCNSSQVSSPNCRCEYPYTGTLYFRAPSFSDLGNSTIYTTLQSSLMSYFQSNQLPVDSVSLSNPTTNTDKYLVISLEVFPSGQDSFNRTGISGIASVFSNQTFDPPSGYGYGPFYFIGNPYSNFAGSAGTKKSLNIGIIIGAAVGGSVLLLLALLAGFYAFHQKRRAEKADKVNNPFASWDPNTTSGGVPMLKGARCFSYDELKRYTNNFAEANCIGAGGYGKVYRGTLPDGQHVAIKRAQQGSMQGGLEFKTEIELLSRVHHKNVVGLMGFCFDEAEQMLVYEYIANGTLNESLSGKTGIRLDWMRRLRIALGAARGLQYLHELANPPIIHRDIKSNNILLDESLNAKVSDFGLSKSVPISEKTHISTQVKGTMGYMDPEYYMTQQLTEKSDVYSFGVVLLEIVTARQPIEKGKHIVREVRQRMERDKVLYSLDEILDPVILAPTPKGLEKFVDLAMSCVEEEGARRPAMGAVVKEIENVMQIVGLNPNADSASSSATYEGDSKGYNHPYTDDSLFVYSGAFPLASN